MTKFRLLILFFMVLIFTSGYSQESMKPLTLQECIEIALKNNSQLRNAENRLELAGTSVTSARSFLLPSINTSFSAGKFVQGARVVTTDVPVGIDPITGRVKYEQRQIIQPSAERNSYGASASLNQNIFDFGQTIYTLKQANANQESWKHAVQNTRNRVVQSVKQAYYDLLKQQRLVTVRENAVNLATEQVNRVQTMLDIGLASRAEVFQSRVNLGSNQTNLLTQRNIYSMARANLNSTLGLDPSLAIEVVEDISEPLFPEYDFDQAIRILLENNEEIKNLELAVKSAGYAINIAKGRFLPNLGANVSYRRSNDDIGRVYSSELDKDFTATFSIGADLNIFNGFADKAAVQRESINMRIARENLAETKRILISEVKQYYLELQAYKDILEIQRENVKAAEENLRLQLEKRRVGSGTELEVNQAQAELIQAQTSLVEAEYNSKTSKAQLEAALGIIDKEK